MRKSWISAALPAVAGLLVSCSPGNAIKGQGEVVMQSKDRLELLNIVPMLPDHQEELAADTLDLYRRGCATSAAFILTLVPEGNPPVDKAKILGERFERFRSALGKTDMPIGILIQATIGHGWIPNSRSPFQTMTLGDGKEYYMFCPLDGEFQKYVYETVRRVTALRPDFLMVDDDFRLLTGRDGCFCPLHVARFNQEHNTSYTRDQLMAAVRSDAKLAAEYDALLKESLIELAKVIRSAINAVDPAMPCTFCACCFDPRHAADIARVLAAPGQELTVRINNARYLNESLRTFPEWMMFTARQVAAYPDDFKLLAEPDTFPHNRYSTSATMMHAHLTGSILEGCRGGKLWLTRTRTFEPESGAAFRRTLEENAGFYRTLAALPVEWIGAATALPAVPPMNFPTSVRKESDVTWSTQLLGKMGIPFFFTTEPSGLVTLAGRDCEALSDAQLSELLSRENCLLDATAAIAACERGFAPLLGVEARAWEGKPVSLERTADGGVIPSAASSEKGGQIAELRMLPGTKELSKLYHTASGVSLEEEYLMPGSTFHTNADGGRVAVIASPVMSYGHSAFGMLTETRKAQLLGVFQLLGGLPWYVPGDDEILLKSGKSGRYDIAVLMDLSLDDVPAVRLAGDAQTVASVEELLPDGEWGAVPFSVKDSELRVDRELRPLRPLVLRIGRR